MNQIYMEMTDQNTIILSNRSGKDRRTKSGFNIRSFLFGGKRENIRRQEDTRRIFYVDNYSPGLFFTIVSILFLCVIDALLTLSLLNHGAYETNPVMAFFLKFGPYTFFTSKYLLTFIPVICLLMFQKYCYSNNKDTHPFSVIFYCCILPGSCWMGTLFTF